VVHHYVGVDIIDEEAIRQVVANDHIIGRWALMGLVAHGDERFALDARARPLVARPEVVKNRVVDDLAAVHARVGDAPAGGGDDNVVRYREVRPIPVEGVDALKEVRERQIWIALTFLIGVKLTYDAVRALA
jgi:hypothetical protein